MFSADSVIAQCVHVGAAVLVDGGHRAAMVNPSCPLNFLFVLCFLSPPPSSPMSTAPSLVLAFNLFVTLFVFSPWLLFQLQFGGHYHI